MPPKPPTLLPGSGAYNLDTLIQNLLGVAARLIGIAAFIMIVVAGYQYLTSMGDPKKTETAQKTFTGAVIGITLIIVGWLAIRLLEALTGANLTEINLKFGS
ncbi:MAG: hypothetical protein HYS86_05065 [Candidatus Chisholmbacteria bacterium]|nr:hypothetical protein [Candidatus Chisholmbacteria bacterium]